jgi:hypothetical protein
LSSEKLSFTAAIARLEHKTYSPCSVEYGNPFSKELLKEKMVKTCGINHDSKVNFTSFGTSSFEIPERFWMLISSFLF